MTIKKKDLWVNLIGILFMAVATMSVAATRSALITQSVTPAEAPSAVSSAAASDADSAITNVAVTSTTPTAKRVAKTSTESTVKSAAKTSTESTAKSAAKTSAGSTAKSVAKTSTTSVTKSAAATHSKPVANHAFDKFIKQLREDLLKDGISEDVVNEYIISIKPKQTRSKASAHRKYKPTKLDHYYNTLVNDKMVKQGQAHYHNHRYLLKEINKRYDVEPAILIALWGIESHFGQWIGSADLIETLGNMSYQHHRSKYFRQELVDAFRMLGEGVKIPEQLKSTFDGGMGQTQFEPTSYFIYAVDFDKDGFKNIWTSHQDSLASIANYLKTEGWDGSQTWGIEVEPVSDPALVLHAKKKKMKPAAEWSKLGVKPLKKDKLPDNIAEARLLLPDGVNGRAFLVTKNVDVLLRWNHLTYEALTVGILSDEIEAVKPKNS